MSSTRDLPQRGDDLRLMRGQREVAGVLDDDEPLRRRLDGREVGLHERRGREQVVASLNDVLRQREAERSETPDPLRQ